jgi:hypothetical protein
MIRGRRLWPRIVQATLIVSAALALIGAKPASKITVLDRVRIGGFAEDLAYVTTGPLAHHIAFVEGYEIWGIPGQATGDPKARKLFDLYGLNPVPRPTGIAYVESRMLFAVNDTGPSNFYFVDHQGRPHGGASMTFPLPDGYTPSYIEGIGYIPPTAGQFPDHLVMAAQNDDGSGDLLVVDLAGNVVKHFVPHCYDASGNTLAGVASVEYLPGDRLVLTDFNYQSVCVVDFDGESSTPAIFPDAPGGIGEGVTRLADGRIVVAEWPQNLLFFDADLNRLPADDRQVVIGLGLNQPQGLAWDGDTGRHLISHIEPGSGVPSAISAVPVPPKLDSTSKIVDLTDYPDYTPPYFLQTRALSYLKPESRIAVASLGRGNASPPPGLPLLPWLRGLLLYDAGGALSDQIDLCVPSATYAPSICTNNYGSRQPSNQWGRAIAVTYIPGAAPADGMFAVRFRVGVTSPDPGVADAYTVYLFSRSGVPAGQIDFNVTAGMTNVTALEYFDPGDGTGGRFAILGRIATSTDPQLLITDLAGNRLDSLNVRTELGLPTPSELSVITTGPQKGAFAVLDGTAQTLVVLRIK